MNFDGIAAECAWLEDDDHQNQKLSRIGKKLHSTLPCGSRKVEYKFFIEVIECCYASVLGMQRSPGASRASAGSFQGSATLPETALGPHHNVGKPI